MIFCYSPVIIHYAELLLLFGAKSLHGFHMESVYIISRGQQTVMFVKTPMANKGQTFHYHVREQLRRQTSRSSIGTVHIGRNCLVI